MQKEIAQQKQHQCDLCKEILSDDYIAQYPFPELPCPCCGSLIELSSSLKEEFTSHDKRREERCDASLKVTYRNFKRFKLEYTKNVSRGGMFIKTKSAYEIGSWLDLLLYVPGLDEPIRITGRVRHNSFFPGKDEDDGIGIEFIGIDEKSREALIQFAKKQKKGRPCPHSDPA